MCVDVVGYWRYYLTNVPGDHRTFESLNLKLYQEIWYIRN